MINFLSKFISSAAITAIVAPHLSFAYIDPGTGSFIVQAVLGVIFGASLALRIFWRKIWIFFKKVFRIRTKKDIPSDDGQKQGGSA